MIAHNLDVVRSDDGVVIFPAYEIGKSQLINFVRSLGDYGLLNRVLLIAPEDAVQVLPLRPDLLITENIESAEILCKRIEDLGKKRRLRFVSVLAVDEEMQFLLSAAVARYFQLPFYSEAVCWAASVKYLSKTVFRVHNVPTGDFTLVSDADPDAAVKIGFPNVLKPLAGTQSHYIFPNRDMEEYRRNFSLLAKAAAESGADPRFTVKTAELNGERFTLDPRKQFLLEAFIPGMELSCDFIVQKGRTQLIRVVQKIPGTLFGMFRGYRLLNRRDAGLIGLDLERLLEVCRGIAAGYGLQQGICMADFKLNRDGIFVLESSIRPGLSAFNHLMYILYGYTSLLLLMMMNMGVDIDVDIPEKTGAVIFLSAPGAGYLREMNISRLMERGAEFGLLDVHRFTDSACVVKDSIVDHSDLLQGYALLENAPLENLESLADEVAACVDYCFEENQDHDIPG